MIQTLISVISLLSWNDTLTISSLGTPTKASASFDGWYTTGDNVTSEKVGEGSWFTISDLTNGKLELYAVWSCDEGYSFYEWECQKTRYTVTIEGSGEAVSLEGTTFSGYYHSWDNVSLTFTANPDWIISWTWSDENVVITSGDNGHTISFTMPNSDIILYPSIQKYRSLSFSWHNHITIKSWDMISEGLTLFNPVYFHFKTLRK